MGEHKVLGFEVLGDGSTCLLAENGQALTSSKILNKGLGLSGYVSRMKRAYYSNSVKRDPIASTGVRSEEIECELCVPVIICCQTIKFSEKVQVDSYVSNELGKVIT